MDCLWEIVKRYRDVAEEIYCSTLRPPILVEVTLEQEIYERLYCEAMTRMRVSPISFSGTPMKIPDQFLADYQLVFKRGPSR